MLFFVFFVIAKDVTQIDKNNSSLLSQTLKFSEIQKLLLKSNSVKSSNFFKEIEHISLFKNLKVTLIEWFWSKKFYLYFFNIKEHHRLRSKLWEKAQAWSTRGLHENSIKHWVDQGDGGLTNAQHFAECQSQRQSQHFKRRMELNGLIK